MTVKNTHLRNVWDVPIRLIHWAIVLLFGALWWTAENLEMDLHRYAGYALLALLVFRLYWGFAGSSTARFASFLRRPSVVWHYAKSLARRDKPLTLGHNPLGGWSSLLLILLLLVQVLLGLFAVDVDGWEAGPLNTYVSFETGRLCAEWHEIVFNTLLVFVALHIVAVFYYVLWRKHNLLKTMFTGKAEIIGEHEMVAAKLWHYVIGIVLAILSLWWFI